MEHAGRFGLLFLLGLFSAGCTGLPTDAPRTVSLSTDLPAVTQLDPAIDRQIQQRPGESILIPLSDGNDALGARLRMIRTAEHQIDMQYFLLKPDLAGATVVLALLEAAERGVRVRFLLDDVFTTAADEDLAVLDAHPNVEVRLANPLSRKSPKFWNYLVDFQRVNRRMHNKSMTVDRNTAIIGGRNIADEYFRVDTTTEFADFDIFLAGPVVQDIADQFDIYWNDPLSLPLESLVSVEPRALVEIEEEIEAREAEAVTGLYRRATESRYLEEVRAGQHRPFFADTQTSYDLPEKLKVPVPDGERILAQDLLVKMLNAKREVILVTPYFVPENWGAQFFSDLAARGVRVRIVTNSLASTNHPYVHAGYERHRKNLLRSGVELHEVRADAIAKLTGDETAAKVTMHTKLALVDRETIFVGSMNFDPRSIKINSEFGIFFEDRDAGAEFLRSFDEDLSDLTYSVQLGQDDELIWIYDNGTVREVVTSEPGASGWRKFLAGLTGLLPVEGQL